MLKSQVVHSKGSNVEISVKAAEIFFSYAHEDEFLAMNLQNNCFF